MARAGTAEGDPCTPVPLQIGIFASLGHPRRTTVWGGEATYPAPEPFDLLSEIPVGTSNWADLLDGQHSIYIDDTAPVVAFGGEGYIEDGWVTLNKAILVVDGTLAPEPATILIFLGKLKAKLNVSGTFSGE
jgi:hypothetical protein